MNLFSHLLLLLTPLLITADPVPTPLPLTFNKRAQCNADNCLRALKRHTASDFCTAYTTATSTATIGLPTYLTACGDQPTRISSACSCLVTPTCAADVPTQVVMDSGFEEPTPTAGFNEGPWTVTAVTTPPYPYGPYPEYDISGSLAHSGLGTFFFYGYIYSGRGLGFNGVVTLTQTLTFCPSTEYTLSVYVGYWDDYDPAIFNTTITIYLDDKVIVPTQLTCSSFSQCGIPLAEAVFKGGYRDILSTIVTPATNTGVLKIVFVQSSTTADNPALYATILDDVTLTKV